MTSCHSSESKFFTCEFESLCENICCVTASLKSCCTWYLPALVRDHLPATVQRAGHHTAGVEPHCGLQGYILYSVHTVHVYSGNGAKKDQTIEEGFLQKKRQRSSLMLKGHNFFNFLPRKLFCISQVAATTFSLVFCINHRKRLKT